MSTEGIFLVTQRVLTRMVPRKPIYVIVSLLIMFANCSFVLLLFHSSPISGRDLQFYSLTYISQLDWCGISNVQPCSTFSRTSALDIP